MGSASARALLAELNKGAFFWLGLGASTARLEVKPPASEADGGGMGVLPEGRKSRGNEAAWESKGSCHWMLQRQGTLMPTYPGRRMPGAGADARSLSSSHDAIVMPVVLPLCQATPIFTKYIWFCFRMAQKCPTARREWAHRQMSKQRVRHLAPHQFQQVSADGKCQLLAPPHHSRHSQNCPTKANCDPPAQQQLCAAVQALLAQPAVRVLAPECTSYFHVMDVEENVFACGEGMWMAGWGWEWGWQGRQAGLAKGECCLEMGSAGPGLCLGEKLVCRCVSA